jgi:hypothetical protein
MALTRKRSTTDTPSNRCHPVPIDGRGNVASRKPSREFGVKPTVVSDRQLTDDLARRVMGWGVHPDRYVTSGRSWISQWRFQPLKRLDEAFALLDHSTSHYRIEQTVDGAFTVQVRIDGHSGNASGVEKARAICLALGRALRLDGFGASTSHPKHRSRPQDRKEPK